MICLPKFFNKEIFFKSLSDAIVIKYGLKEGYSVGEEDWLGPNLHKTVYVKKNSNPNNFTIAIMNTNGEQAYVNDFEIIALSKKSAEIKVRSCNYHIELDAHESFDELVIALTSGFNVNDYH